jgi:uncharacterized protein YbbC (DUF1343 family)
MFNTFKKSIPFLGLLFLIASCSINKAIPVKNWNQKSTLSENQNSIRPNQSISFKTGADNSENYLPLLKDKKVGVVSNQTGILSNKIHLVDFLVSNAIQVQKIFAPEHGFRGTADAGELIIDGKDTKTGLPIISLYGANKKPIPEQLEGIDILIFDIQDYYKTIYLLICFDNYYCNYC